MATATRSCEWPWDGTTHLHRSWDCADVVIPSVQQLHLKYARWQAAGDVSAAKSRNSIETVATAKKASEVEAVDEAEAAAEEEVEAAAVAKAAVEAADAATIMH